MLKKIQDPLARFGGPPAPDAGGLFSSTRLGDCPTNGTPTSNAAADSVKEDAETLRQKVLSFLKSQGDYGATDEEMQHALDMQGNTQRPRRQELYHRSLITLSGRTRTTSSGRQAAIWVAL